MDQGTTHHFFTLNEAMYFLADADQTLMRELYDRNPSLSEENIGELFARGPRFLSAEQLAALLRGERVELEEVETAPGKQLSENRSLQELQKHFDITFAPPSP